MDERAEESKRERRPNVTASGSKSLKGFRREIVKIGLREIVQDVSIEADTGKQ